MELVLMALKLIWTSRSTLQLFLAHGKLALVKKGLATAQAGPDTEKEAPGVIYILQALSYATRLHLKTLFMEF
jgi:hypothetical protein